ADPLAVVRDHLRQLAPGGDVDEGRLVVRVAVDVEPAAVQRQPQLAPRLPRRQCLEPRIARPFGEPRAVVDAVHRGCPPRVVVMARIARGAAWASCWSRYSSTARRSWRATGTPCDHGSAPAGARAPSALPSGTCASPPFPCWSPHRPD